MRVIRLFTIFLFYLSFYSGSSVAEIRHLKAIERRETLGSQDDEMFFSSGVSTSELDSVPVVNPTTPGTDTTPPITESPPAPATTTPITESPPAPATPTTQPTPTTPTTSSGGEWCIASASASETALQVALDYACGYGGTDCSAIQPGASCYNPNTVHDHASYAFNDYYQKNPIPTSCVFGGAAQLTSTDPSSGSCHYASAKTTTPSIPPPSPPTIMTPPTTMTPTTETPPTFTPPFGVAEPIGEPSSTTDISCSLQLLFFTVGVSGFLLARNHL